MNIAQFIQQEPKLRDQKEIIIYGGSFNPWHSGHMSCLELAPKSIPIIIVPDNNPEKEIVSVAEKNQILDKIKKHLEKSDRGVFLYDGFLKLNRKNPSHQWTALLKTSYPNKDFSLLMGFDSFMGIDNWIQSEALLQNITTLYIASRLEKTAQQAKQSDVLLSLNPTLRIIFLG
ncbi:MAG: hypothetical protein HON90_06820, partial [Halobacteriovoraceae bacterium]|nr:hypothetical protein [Halobacteriovoraceae bacterium]